MLQTCMTHLIRAAIRCLAYTRPQTGRCRTQTDLHRTQRKDPEEYVGRVRGLRAGPEAPLNGHDLGELV